MFDSRLYPHSWRLCKFPTDRLFDIKSDNEIIHDARDLPGSHISVLEHFLMTNENYVYRPSWKSVFHWRKPWQYFVIICILCRRYSQVSSETSATQQRSEVDTSLTPLKFHSVETLHFSSYLMIFVLLFFENLLLRMFHTIKYKNTGKLRTGSSKILGIYYLLETYKKTGSIWICCIFQDSCQRKIFVKYLTDKVHNRWNTIVVINSKL